MVDSTSFLPGLSPVAGKAVVARFDGGRLSSEGGLLALREVERRLGLAERLAGCLTDRRAPERVRHGLEEIIGFRMLMIAAGYEDGNDADALRRDPMFTLALERLPSGADLCSQSTISRLENLPDRRALLRLAGAFIDQYCASFRQVPKRIVLNIDDTFDRVHGGQQLRLFNAFHNDYGFQPIVVFDGEGCFVTALLRPGQRPSGKEARALRRRLIGALRTRWPRVEVLVRADSHYTAPEVLNWCHVNRVDFVLGLAPNVALHRHVADLEGSTAERFAARAAGTKLRRYKEFYDAAGSWSRAERIIARVEVGPQGATPATSSPTSKAAGPRSSTSGSTARAAKPRTTSRRSRIISRPTAPPAIRPKPTNSGCSCMPARIGCCGRCARPCRGAPPGASCNSTRCGCA